MTVRTWGFCLAGLMMGCSTHHAIIGSVVDRNGEPMERVLVTLDPGGVEMITDSEGRFMIDYLRGEAGERIRLSKKTDYGIEYFRTGFHIEQSKFYFKKGELFLEPITLAEDTIRVTVSDETLDPADLQQGTQSAGATYEGE